MKFAEIKMRQMFELMNVEIGEHFIDGEAMDEVKRILDLDGKTAEELTAIRNTVVRTLHEEFIEPLLKEGKYKTLRKYEITMSGVTAVIDNELFKMGALY